MEREALDVRDVGGQSSEVSRKPFGFPGRWAMCERNHRIRWGVVSRETVFQCCRASSFLRGRVILLLDTDAFL